MAVVLALTAAAAVVLAVETALGGDASPPAADRADPRPGRAGANEEKEATGATPPTPTEGKVTIAATGDVTMGRAPVLPPDGGASLFGNVARHLRGDVVLGNVETALATGGSSKCGAGSPNCFAFRAPPSYARWLKRAGFTVMNLANNHSYDFGAQGQRETVSALRRFGLRHTGRPGEIAYQRAGGVRVAILGFAPYPWAQDLLDLRAARRLVKKADTKADVVVVTMHAGAEGADRMHVRPGPETYLGEPRGDSLAFARAVVDAGADLVVGHGPHVLRGMEWYRGRLVAYSLGNFSGYHNFSLSGPLPVAGILRVTLRADASWARGRLIATRMVAPGTPVLDPAEEAHGIVRSLSRADFGRRGARLTKRGMILPPR